MESRGRVASGTGLPQLAKYRSSQVSIAVLLLVAGPQSNESRSTCGENRWTQEISFR